MPYSLNLELIQYWSGHKVGCLEAGYGSPQAAAWPAIIGVAILTTFGTQTAQTLFAVFPTNAEIVLHQE